MTPYTTTIRFCRLHRTVAQDLERCDMFDSIEFTETAASLEFDTSILVCDIRTVHVVECQTSST